MARPEQSRSERGSAEMRAAARKIFDHALAESSVARAFDRHLESSRSMLRVGEDLYDLSSYSRTFVVAFGKAAHTMAESLVRIVGGTLAGIVVAPTAPQTQLQGFRYFQGGHPLPNAESLRAGAAILRSLNLHTAKSLVLFLISGGGSSVVEKPVDADITLEDLVATNRALVHCGAPIAEINAIRKHLSLIKGGRMALAAAPAQQVSIMVSDVPAGALDSLASGPTLPDSSTVDDCYRIAHEYDLLAHLPQSVKDLFTSRSLEETPKGSDPAFQRSRYWPILDTSSLLKAAAEQATLAGFAVEIDNSCDDWDYARAADHLLARLRELRKGVSKVCLISGGEVTVKVKDGGRGGRNQHFALYCAQKIAGENIAVLSAGTDGIDGNSPAAGAIVDGTTVARAHAAGIDPRTALRKFDAFPLFNQLEDAIMIGPTGNNIRDLRVLLAS